MASSIGDVAGFVRSQFGDSWQCKRCNVCMSTVAIQALLNARIEPKSMHGCAADEMSDEQLRAECKRRGLDVYDPPPALHEVIDALLPECPGAVAWNAIKARVDELLALEKMAKSPKTVIMTNLAVPEGLEIGRVFSTPRPFRVVVESHVRPLRIPNADAFQFVCPDGTKVEVATEAIKAALLLEVESINAPVIEAAARLMSEAAPWGFSLIGAPNPPAWKSVPCTCGRSNGGGGHTLNCEQNIAASRESLHRSMLSAEQGTGIASIPKPDNSHYVLDVDLLADDA